MDLTTRYLGLTLKNPLVVSAGPLSESVDRIREMEEAGAAAVVMFSIFEEQIAQEAELLERRITAGSESFAEALSYFPRAADYHVGPEAYLELIHKAATTVQIPIIGSLNGVTPSGWTTYARQIQEAGAHAIELNIYFVAADPKISGAEVERQYLEVLKAVKSAVTIPVAVKVGPFFSSFAHMAHQLDQAGADGLVLFNRFYQPDIRLEDLTIDSTLSLSTPEDIRLPLRWIAILRGRVRASLAASGGVHSGREVVKYLLAGADVVMTTAALLKKGIRHLATLKSELEDWLEENEYSSVAEMRGILSQRAVADPSAFERANYIKIIEKYKGEYRMT